MSEEKEITFTEAFQDYRNMTERWSDAEEGSDLKESLWSTLCRMEGQLVDKLAGLARPPKRVNCNGILYEVKYEQRQLDYLYGATPGQLDSKNSFYRQKISFDSEA